MSLMAAADPAVSTREGVALPVRPYLRGWSHLIAAIAAIVLCPIVIVTATDHRGSIALYAAAVIGLFAISGSYHRIFWGTRVHGLFRRLDHAMIFLVIAATYTPIVLTTLDPLLQKVVLGAVWVGAIGGAMSQVFWTGGPRWLTVLLYMLVGWAIVPGIGQVAGALTGAGFALLIVGGVLHTLGGLVYAVKVPNPSPRWFGFHEVFHVLVIAAIAAHYVVIVFFLAPGPMA